VFEVPTGQELPIEPLELLNGVRNRQQLTRRSIWTMTKGGEAAWAELRDQGVAGVELQLFRGDDFANGRLYSSREAALDASALRRQQMIGKGWLDAAR
jgi:hypothetical protein